MPDRTDHAILDALIADARLSMRELAARVHMSAPAVTERVRRLEIAGIITGYAAQVDAARLRPTVTGFVDVLMNSADHAAFLRFARASPAVRDVHRGSGDACYLLRVEVPDHAALGPFLEELLAHANYRLNVVLSSG